MTASVSRTIKSKTEHLLDVREFVSSAAQRLGFSDEETSKIVLAVDEACTNIIKHAYQYDPNKEIRISINTTKGALEILIEDEGKSFNPLTVKPPDLKQHLKQFRRGGLGVYLMKTLMDEVEYNLNPGKKNVVRLLKYLPQNR